MNGTAEGVYLNLLEHPGDPDRMLVLADALEESGEEALGAAYRWAARNGKWPFTRWNRVPDSDGRVYDWEGEHRGLADSVVASARLPETLYGAIRDLPDRNYGDVNDAFVLLARALPGLEGV